MRERFWLTLYRAHIIIHTHRCAHLQQWPHNVSSEQCHRVELTRQLRSYLGCSSIGRLSLAESKMKCLGSCHRM